MDSSPTKITTRNTILKKIPTTKFNDRHLRQKWKLIATLKFLFDSSIVIFNSGCSIHSKFLNQGRLGCNCRIAKTNPNYGTFPNQTNSISFQS